jgi:nucleotide-binding universal stress UspA family protein
MFNKILVPVDGSPASAKALTAAVDLATLYKADLTALGVAELPAGAARVEEVDEFRKTTEARFRKIGESAVEYARSRGVTLRSVVVRGHVADAIVHYAERDGINLVVIGQHGQSQITRYFLDSISNHVSEHVPCTVMIIK